MHMHKGAYFKNCKRSVMFFLNVGIIAIGIMVVSHIVPNFPVILTLSVLEHLSSLLACMHLALL